MPSQLPQCYPLPAYGRSLTPSHILPVPLAKGTGRRWEITPTKGRYGFWEVGSSSHWGTLGGCHVGRVLVACSLTLHFYPLACCLVVNTNHTTDQRIEKLFLIQ